MAGVRGTTAAISAARKMPLHSGRRVAILLLWLPLSLSAQAPLPQVEQARQISGARQLMDQQDLGSLAPLPDASASATGDDAFGAQIILKRQERPRPFSAFAEISAFATNNVALTPRDRLDDNFLVLSAGVSFSQPLGYDLRVDGTIRSAVYRYAEFRELDFQSVDAIAGLTWSPPILRGVEVVTRYIFTDLSTAERIREFYTNHAVLLGLQKVVPFSRAHGIYLGATAQWSATDPKETGRDEYSGFLGARAQLTRHLEADLSYRYSRYVYRDAAGREDNNHSLALALRYAPIEWLTLSASGFLGFNRSNQPVFDYDVGNLGVGVQVSVRF